MELNYIYLIQERESLRCGDNVYKLGRTTQQPLKRMNSYPVGSKILMIIIVDDAYEAEKDLLETFRETFIKADYGNEYFIGDPKEMMNIIYDYQVESWSTEVYDVVAKYESKQDDEKNLMKIIGYPIYDYVNLLKSNYRHVISKKSHGVIKLTQRNNSKYEINSISIIDKNNTHEISYEDMETVQPYNNKYIELNKYQRDKFSEVLKNKNVNIVIFSFDVRKLKGTFYYKFTIIPGDD